MTTINPEIKRRISQSKEFISGNNLSETELQAELTGLVLFTLLNQTNDMNHSEEGTNNYLRKNTENNTKNNYEK